MQAGIRKYADILFRHNAGVRFGQIEFEMLHLIEAFFHELPLCPGDKS
jgi:hypothetical protein